MRRKVFLAAAVLFLASCSKQKQVEPVIQVVRAGVVEEIRPGPEERYSVSIEPFEKVDLAFKSGGIVEGILQVRGADGRMRNVQAGDKVASNAAEEGVKAAEDGVKAAENGVAKAAAAVKEAKLSLRDTTLNAPFAGWISARNVDRGSLVNGSTIGFTIEDTHLVKAAFAVPDSTLSGIRRGQKQPVLLEPLQRTATGVITSISPHADPQSRVFTIEVTLDNPREDIRPGMIGSLILGRARDSRPRLVVPLTAVVRAPGDPNGFAVFRLIERDGKSCVSAQTIEIGETYGDSIEVTRGLSAGQKIISLGGAQLHDGQQVSVLP